MLFLTVRYSRLSLLLLLYIWYSLCLKNYLTEIPQPNDDPYGADEDEDENVQTEEGHVDSDTVQTEEGLVDSDTKTQKPQLPKSRGKYSTLILLLNVSSIIFHSIEVAICCWRSQIFTYSVECLA